MDSGQGFLGGLPVAAGCADVILSASLLSGDGAEYGREGCDDCDGGGCDRYIPDFPNPGPVSLILPEISPYDAYQVLPGLRTAVRADGGQVLYSPDAAAQVAVISPRAQEVLEFFQLPHTLQQLPASPRMSAAEAESASRLLAAGGFLVRPGEPAGLRPLRQPGALEAWLYVTRDCNLECAHCYVKKDTRRMSSAAGERAVRQLFDQALREGYRTVKIKYAGGEPTLRWGFVQKLHALAQSLSRQTGLGLRGILVTNGAGLTDAQIDYLKENDVTLSVSLDGFGAGHDAQRPAAGGGESFSQVLAGLEKALSAGVRPLLTMTLTSLNLADLPRVTAYALERDLSLNINFYRPLGGDDPLLPRPAELVAALRQALAVIRANLPSYRIIDRLIDRSNFGVSHRHTCGAGRNYLSIDTDGSVQPCHMLHAMDLPGRMDAFVNPSIEDRPDCAACQWKGWCTGGCPIVAERMGGAPTARSLYCAVYRAIYPELIQLEAERLVRYGTPAV